MKKAKKVCLIRMIQFTRPPEKLFMRSESLVSALTRAKQKMKLPEIFQIQKSETRHYPPSSTLRQQVAWGFVQSAWLASILPENHFIALRPKSEQPSESGLNSP